MAIFQRFSLIVVIFFLSGCADIKLLLVRLHLRSPEGAAELAAARDAEPPTTPCCLCILRSTNENTIRPYLNPDECEKKSNSDTILTCRQVQAVSNPSCTFAKIQWNKEGMVCNEIAMQVIDGGNMKMISPPASACMTGESEPE